MKNQIPMPNISQMMQEVLFDILQVPASTLRNLIRHRIGIANVPWWHVVVMVLVSAALAWLFNSDTLWFIAAAIFAGGVGQHVRYNYERGKGKKLKPQSPGESFFTVAIPVAASKEAVRIWWEPAYCFITGLLFLFHGPWILGFWLMVSAIALHFVEEISYQKGVKSGSRKKSFNPLSPKRIAWAFAIAVAVDAIQVPLTGAELTGLLLIPAEIADILLDCLCTVLICSLLGFHWILLPSFILEVVPAADMLPTWTACVAFIVWRRKREQSRTSNAICRPQVYEAEIVSDKSES